MKLFISFMLLSVCCAAQNIPSRWDELIASDWPKAMKQSNKTCILPIGILEKHGLQAPIGSDLIHVREWAARATKIEYAVVFPDFFYGQINEARHQPGTFSLPSHLVLELLDSTCAEIARNGFDKILIINKHGGNPELIRYFIQTQLERRRNYAVYYFDPEPDSSYNAKVSKLRKTDPEGDHHAGENETSTLLYLRPDLVKLDSSKNESGENQKRLHLTDLYTAIEWYASYPNHYAGDASKATKEFGKLITENVITHLVAAIKEVKADTKTLQLQKEFFDRVDKLGHQNN
jgi:creatinine amidohydrolase